MPAMQLVRLQVTLMISDEKSSLAIFRVVHTLLLKLGDTTRFVNDPIIGDRNDHDGQKADARCASSFESRGR